jgi:peptidylprolyl isomerase
MKSRSPLTNRPSRWVKTGAIALCFAVIPAVALGACSDSESDSSTSSTISTVVKTKSLDKVKVSGPLDEKPTVEFKPAFAGEEDEFRVIKAGTGPEVASGDRITVNYVAIGGSEGAELDTTWGAAPQKITVGTSAVLPIIDEAIIGQPVGTRVLVSTDSTEANGQWLLFVFDILDTKALPATAEGESIAPLPNMPAVTIENGVPTIAKPNGDAPKTLIVSVLIKGTGPVVTAGQTVSMQYTGIVWASGTVFDSSWTSGSVDFPVGSGQVIAGFDEGLVGQTVGSRVLIAIPPDKGYGAEGNSQAGIAGTDTLVFVVDILDAY